MDRFSILLWPSAGFSFRTAQFAINDVPLLELVREAERFWVNDNDPCPPGDYLYLSAESVLSPSREWLGSPSKPGFILDDEDPRRGKSTVLGCTCGIVECWFLQVKITVETSVVIWSDFGQFHRPEWIYDLGPFTFDREQYEYELRQGVD